MKEIHILGAGPSGLAAAVTAATKGHKTFLHESRNSIGGSFLDTIHTVRNYKNWFEKDALDYFQGDLGLNIKRSFHPIDSFRRYLPDGTNYTARALNAPILYNVRRGRHKNSLDSELVKQCNDLGVNIELKSKMKAEDCDIIATGAKCMDFKGYGVHFEDFKIDNLNEAKVFFGDSFAPKGYAYIVPFYDNTATIAVFVSADFAKKDMKYYYNQFILHLVRIGVEWSGRAISEDAGIGYFRLPNNFEKDSRLYVGVCGGLMTADYGFALTNALVSGHLAAYSIHTGSNYSQLIKRTIYPELIYAYLKRIKLNNYSEKDLIMKMLSDKRSLEINNGYILDQMSVRWYQDVIARAHAYINSNQYIL